MSMQRHGSVPRTCAWWLHRGSEVVGTDAPPMRSPRFGSEGPCEGPRLLGAQNQARGKCRTQFSNHFLLVQRDCATGYRPGEREPLPFPRPPLHQRTRMGATSLLLLLASAAALFSVASAWERAPDYTWRTGRVRARAAAAFSNRQPPAAFPRSPLPWHPPNTPQLVICAQATHYGGPGDGWSIHEGSCEW